MADAMRSWARSANRATNVSLDPKWWVGSPRLTPARPPMLASDAPSTPRSAIELGGRIEQGLFRAAPSLRLGLARTFRWHTRNPTSLLATQQVL